MDDYDILELKILAAIMYHMLKGNVDMLAECLNPSEEDCCQEFVGCSDCGWYSCELRDRLLRLGVDLDRGIGFEVF